MFRKATRVTMATHRALSSAAATGMTRPRVVNKFGGSSVGSAEAIRRVARVLVDQKEDGVSPVSVTSALYGVTDRLMSSLELAAARNESELRQVRGSLWRLHSRHASDLLQGHNSLKEDVMAYMGSLFEDDFDAVLQGVLERGATAGNDVDVVSSLGERLSTSLLAAHLSASGHASSYFTGEELIVTDGVTGNSSPLLEDTVSKVKSELEPLLEEGVIPCVTGFYGASKDGLLTVLGRGGSDLSAAILGHALDASEVALYKVEYTKDEEGYLDEWQPGWEGVVHDADPTQTISELSYEAAGTLAFFGKEVLHPNTVQPAVSKKIQIAVKNTLAPENPGTVIRARDEVSTSGARDHPVQAITKAKIAEFEGKHGMEVDVENLPKDQASLVILAGTDVMDEEEIVKQRAIEALNEADIAHAVPEEVDGSEHHLSIAVPTEQTKEAIRTLHATFFPDVPTQSSARV